MSELKEQITVAMVDRLIDRIEFMEKKIGLMSREMYQLKNGFSKVNPGKLTGELRKDTIPFDDRIENGGEY